MENYTLYESMAARFERTIKRLITVIIVMVVLLTVTNVAWVIYELNNETIMMVEQKVENTDETIVNGIGDINAPDNNKDR